MRHMGWNIEIVTDEFPMNPRTEQDNFGHMVCFHSRYDLGDKHEPIDLMKLNGWNALARHLKSKFKAHAMLPLFLYDHSGIWMHYERSYPFNCEWDAGQVGFIYCTKEDIRKEFGKVNEQTISKAIALLQSEVKMYNYYISGQMVGYEITDDDGNVVESCTGFTPDDEEYMMSEAKQMVEHLVKKTTETAIQESLAVHNAFNKESVA